MILPLASFLKEQAFVLMLASLVVREETGWWWNTRKEKEKLRTSEPAPTLDASFRRLGDPDPRI